MKWAVVLLLTVILCVSFSVKVNALTLAWDYPIASVFAVYRQVDTSGFTLLSSTSALQYTDASVAANHGYCYNVTATVDGQESVPSNTICVYCKIVKKKSVKTLTCQ